VTIALARIDDRLVHGQVVIGWGVPLKVQAIVLVDDGLAASDWEQEIYRMAVPPGVDLEFTTVAQAGGQLRRWEADPRTVFLLTASVEAMAQLARAGVIRRVNLGGLHAGPGRTERLRYIYLSPGEADALRAIEAGGTPVSAQDLPTSAAVPVRELLR
jgi:PTS system mannose-specific IIB component/fructoselysine and glucoselysine-specific PTS system IIB component